MSRNLRNPVDHYQNTSRSAAVRGLYPSSSMAGPTSHRQSRNRLTKAPPRERSISRVRSTRHELRDSRPGETRSRMPHSEGGTTSRPPNLYGRDFDRTTGHQADRAARHRREDEQLLRTLGQGYQDTEDLTEAQLRIALELSREEERLCGRELEIEMRSLAIAAQEARRNLGLNARYHVEGVTDDEELQIALLASAGQSFPAWSVEVPAARGPSRVEGLSEEEELQFALLASADHSISARLTEGLREDDELQPGLHASEDQSTPRGSGASRNGYLNENEEPQFALPASEHESTPPRSAEVFPAQGPNRDQDLSEDGYLNEDRYLSEDGYLIEDGNLSDDYYLSEGEDYQLTLLESEAQSTPPRSVQVSPAQGPSRDERLSEDEELRPALRASEDQLTPSQLLELHFAQGPTRDEDLSENDERQVDSPASEDQSTTTRSVEAPLARGPTRDERTPDQPQSTSSGCHDHAAEIEQTPSPASTEARPKSSASRDQDSADVRPSLQHIAAESSNTPDRIRTPLPAPIPLSGRQPEWLGSVKESDTFSLDAARGRVRTSDSAEASHASAVSSPGQSVTGPVVASAHISRTSLSSPPSNNRGLCKSPAALSESTRVAVVAPEVYTETHRHTNSPRQTSPLPSPPHVSYQASQPPISSSQPSSDSRSEVLAAQSVSNDTTTSSSHPSHVLQIDPEESVTSIPPLVTNSPHHPVSDAMHNPFTNASQPIVFNGPVTINNIINNGPESRTGLLKRALNQSYKLVKNKANNAVAAKSNADGGSRSSILSQVQTSLSGLDLGLGLRSCNSNRFPLDIDDDEENRAPSPDPSLLGKLDLADERLQSSDDSIHRSRSGRVSGVGYVRAEVDRNGSPVPMRASELHLVTARTPSPPSPPARRPVPPPKPSIASGCAGSNGSRADQVGEVFMDSAVGMSNVTYNPRLGVLAPAPRAGDQQLPQPVGGHTLQTPPPFAIRRKPVASGSFTPVHSVQEAPQQFPIATPRADEVRIDTPDSLYVSPDSPGYMKPTLARKHVHPPMNTEWANVPPAGQKLEHLNSRAMMDIDRFGHGARTAMPSMPEMSDRQAVVDAEGRLTPDTKARKAEKDMQKKLRAAV